MKTKISFGFIFELFIILWVVWLCVPNMAHAGYLDPGSGSVLVQSIISVMAVIGRIKARICGLVGFGRSNKDA